MKRLATIFAAVLEAIKEPPKEPRACCYTCADQIRRGSVVYYSPPLGMNFYCAICGTKIRVENLTYKCIFFQGPKPGEID